MQNSGKMSRVLLILFILFSNNIFGQGSYGKWNQKFEQLGTMLPTPNAYRTASGAPGIDYWQQRADYKIDVTIDDENQMLYGEEIITYFNNSPDVLRYLWVQLDLTVEKGYKVLQTPSRMQKVKNIMVVTKSLM